jgi:hypothetical protein
MVSRDCRPIAEHEPPTFPACLLRDGCQQATGLLIREWKQGQFFASINPGDDPRRPAAEPSAAGIEKDRAPKPKRRRYIRVHVFHHFRKTIASLRSHSSK